MLWRLSPGHRLSSLWPRPLFRSPTPEIIKLGGRAITAFGDDTKEANLVTARYGPCRNLLLREHTWSFATIRSSPAEDTGYDGAPVDFPHAFAVPADCARLLGVLDADDRPVEYRLGDNHVFTNSDTITLRYVMNFEDTDDGFAFPDDFAEALANFLAADICVALTQNQALRDTYLQAYERQLAFARHAGSTEHEDRVIESGSWLDSRDYFEPTRPDMRGLQGY